MQGYDGIRIQNHDRIRIQGCDRIRIQEHDRIRTQVYYMITIQENVRIRIQEHDRIRIFGFGRFFMNLVMAAYGYIVFLCLDYFPKWVIFPKPLEDPIILGQQVKKRKTRGKDTIRLGFWNLESIQYLLLH